jgi:hypothetical protein
VAVRDDDVVRPGEQVDALGELGRLRDLRPLDVGGPGRDRTPAEDLQDVGPTAGFGHVRIGAREGLVGDDVPVVGAPVVHRQDLEEVRYPTELRDGLRESAERHVVEHRPRAVRAGDES